MKLLQKRGDTMFWRRTAVDQYGKPIPIFSGKIGRSILETIRNTPKPDDTKIKYEAERVMRNILKAKANGTF